MWHFQDGNRVLTAEWIEAVDWQLYRIIQVARSITCQLYKYVRGYVTSLSKLLRPLPLADNYSMFPFLSCNLSSNLENGFISRVKYVGGFLP